MSDENENESEHEIEKRLEAAKARQYVIADRVAKAAGFPGELRPGKIVRLKSGGPPMTIAVFDVTDGLVYCHYFFRGRTGQARYSPEMLERCEPSSLESFVPPKKPGPPQYDKATGEVLARAGGHVLQKTEANRDEASRVAGHVLQGTDANSDGALRVAGHVFQETDANREARIRVRRQSSQMNRVSEE
jgi:uncharacterized protein YodC (DUF2158 family)